MSSPLSPYKLGKARDAFNVFSMFNSASWNLLVGSVITLFALRIGANSTYVGLLGAVAYSSFFFLPLGKILARRFSIIGVFSFGWIARSVFMLLAVAAPFVALAGNRDLALLLTLIGVFAFHFFRGIATVGNNPVTSELASGPDRGSYLTQIQILNSAVGMFTCFAVAMVLGREPPLHLYSLILALGVITGVSSGIILKKVPEPTHDEGESKISFVSVFKEAFTQGGIRRFIIIFFLVALVSGVSRTFVVVYAREVFGHNDGMVSLYAVFGGLGFLMIGLFIKFLVDRIGAKPIFIVCVLISLVSMIPVVFFPQSAIDNISTAILFLSFLFFVLHFGFLGSEAIAQTYFMGLVPVEKMLDMGIVYFFVFGIAGVVGSFLSGLLLDTLVSIGVPLFFAFKILFAILIILAGIAVFLQRKLVPLGALPFAGALEVIFSPKDLRAISLLDKLNKTRDSSEEEALLEALHGTPSQLAVKGLLDRARSPRLSTRQEALRAMGSLKSIDSETEAALINDVSVNPYTTAYISARMLGRHGCSSAIPLLRELTSSGDYMLAGEAMIALARLGDDTFLPEIEKIILETQNPRLKIMGAEALGVYASPNCLAALLNILRAADPPPYLRDEVVLAISQVLGVQNQFYPVLIQFLKNQSLLNSLAMDEVEKALEYFRANAGGKSDSRNHALIDAANAIEAAVSDFIREKNGSRLSRWILELPDNLCGAIEKTVLSEAALDEELCGYERLRLFIILWTAQQLRTWVKL